MLNARLLLATIWWKAVGGHLTPFPALPDDSAQDNCHAPMHGSSISKRKQAAASRSGVIGRASSPAETHKHLAFVCNGTHVEVGVEFDDEQLVADFLVRTVVEPNLKIIFFQMKANGPKLDPVE